MNRENRENEGRKFSISYNGVLLRLTDAEKEKKSPDDRGLKLISITTICRFPQPKLMRRLGALLHTVNKIENLPFSTKARYSEFLLDWNYHRPNFNIPLFFTDFLKLAGYQFNKKSRQEIDIYLSRAQSIIVIVGWLSTASDKYLSLGNRLLSRVEPYARTTEEKNEIQWLYCCIDQRKANVATNQLMKNDYTANALNHAFDCAENGSVKAFKYLTHTILPYKYAGYYIAFAKLCFQYDNKNLAKKSLIAYLKLGATIDTWRAHMGLAKIFMEEGEFNEAAMHLTSAYNLYPDHPSIIWSIQKLVSILTEHAQVDTTMQEIIHKLEELINKVCEKRHWGQ